MYTCVSFKIIKTRDCQCEEETYTRKDNYCALCVCVCRPFISQLCDLFIIINSPLSLVNVWNKQKQIETVYLFSFIHSHYRRHRREARLIDWVEGYQRAAVLSLTSALWLIRSIIRRGTLPSTYQVDV
jgi:hypothetical protein